MIELKNVYLGQPANTGVDLYTCPANIAAKVVKCTVTNDIGTADSISFHKVPSGGAVGDDNLILHDEPVGNKETIRCPEVVGQLLNAGDVIHAIPATSAQLTVSLDVVEVTQRS